MITVQIYKDSEVIKTVVITGHANSAQYGKDLVCAAVSAVSVGAINALDELVHKPVYKEDDGYLYVQFENDNDSQLIAKTMIIQLKTIEESNKSYLKIINC